MLRSEQRAPNPFSAILKWFWRRINRIVFRKHYKKMDKIYSNYLYRVERGKDLHEARMRTLEEIWECFENKK